MRAAAVLSLCLPLLTTGCFVGDGVAHVVKLANKSLNSSSDSGPPQQAQTPPPPMAVEASNAPADRNPAPMPAADTRDQVRVEELPPKG